MNIPEKFIERMRDLPDFDEFVKCYDKPSLSGMRINRNKVISKSIIEESLGSLMPVPWCENGFYAGKDKLSGNDPLHMAGLIYFQEPSAMCAANMLPLADGDFVLDLCAAPGGKSTQIAENKNITLVSNEIIPKRSRILSENIERMGFSNTVVLNEAPEKLEKIFDGFFDKIIIDAPCSGEGMFRKEPAAIDAWSPEHVSSCAVRQRKIIDSAMKMLSSGGAIVYSTCTFSKEENEDNVDYILENYSYMKLIKTEKLYPHRVEGEGHFAALLIDTREKIKTDRKAKVKTASNEAIKLYKEFENIFLNCTLDGKFVTFGENLYLLPEGIPTDGLKIVRAGLHLGECKKGRFEPSHALAKHLNKEDFKSSADYNRNDIEVIKYLHGETLSGDFSGFGVVTCEGLPLGWVKGSDGMLKNHFPKGLRL